MFAYRSRPRVRIPANDMMVLSSRLLGTIAIEIANGSGHAIVLTLELAGTAISWDTPRGDPRSNRLPSVVLRNPVICTEAADIKASPWL